MLGCQHIFCSVLRPVKLLPPRPPRAAALLALLLSLDCLHDQFYMDFDTKTIKFEKVHCGGGGEGSLLHMFPQFYFELKTCYPLRAGDDFLVTKLCLRKVDTGGIFLFRRKAILLNVQSSANCRLGCLRVKQNYSSLHQSSMCG